MLRAQRVRAILATTVLSEVKVSKTNKFTKPAFVRHTTFEVPCWRYFNQLVLLWDITANNS